MRWRNRSRTVSRCGTEFLSSYFLVLALNVQSHGRVLPGILESGLAVEAVPSQCLLMPTWFSS